MATCRTCAYLRKCIEKATKEGYEHNVDFDASSGCPNFGFKSNTNADRIRAMSDEELAKAIDAFNAYFDACNRKDADCNDCELFKICSICEGKAIEWLKQPAEVDKDA